VDERTSALNIRTAMNISVRALVPGECSVRYNFLSANNFAATFFAVSAPEDGGAVVLHSVCLSAQ